MNNLEKTSITRVFVDLIKADDILDITEMDYLARMRKKYGLDTEHLVAAQKMDFGTAVNNLQHLPQETVRDFIEDVKGLSLSDGYCAPEEAFLLIALSLFLDSEYGSYCKLITTETTAISIDKGDVVYTEMEYDEEANTLIKSHLRYIVNDFRLAGLDFVYVPKIAEDYKNMKEDYLHSVIEFISPTLPDEEQQKIFNTLRAITTQEFCYEFLIKKIGLDPIFDSDPSILLQIANSNNRKVYLHVALRDDVLKDLMKFVDLFKSMTRCCTPIKTFYNDSERFIYGGFHRAMFDILAFPGKNIESRILIDVYKKKIVFMDLRETLNLHTKQMALYILIIQQSLCTRCQELQIDSPSEKRMKEMCSAFNKIYGMMSCSPDSDFRSGLTPALSHIKKAITEVRFLDNAKAYIPERSEGTIKVRIKPSKVFVLDSNMHPVPMTESEEWKKL